MSIQVFVETLHYHATSPAPFVGLTTVFRLEHPSFESSTCFCCVQIGNGVLKDISVALSPEHTLVSSLTKLRMVSLLGLIYTTEHAIKDKNSGWYWLEEVTANEVADMNGWRKVSSVEWPVFLGGVLNDDVTLSDPYPVREAPKPGPMAHAAVQPDPTIDPWDLLFS